MLSGVAALGALTLFERSRALWVAILLWYAASSAWAHPDYLAYFNDAAFGKAGTYGVDSDLDWGQDLERLRQACERRQIKLLSMAYFGSADPRSLGVPIGLVLTPGVVQSGWVAISIFKLRVGEPKRPDAYAWLNKYQPVERVGKSILLYSIVK